MKINKDSLKKAGIAGLITGVALTGFSHSATNLKSHEENINHLKEEKAIVANDIRKEQRYIDWFNANVANEPNSIQEELTGDDYVADNVDVILGENSYTSILNHINSNMDKETSSMSFASLLLILTGHIAMPAGIAAGMFAFDSVGLLGSDEDKDSEEELQIV